MLTIRLSRTGKKKAPQYRVVLQESHRDPWSPAIEILGHYNPRKESDNIVLKQERIEYWLGNGAQPSATVFNLLVDAGIIKDDKKNSVTITNKRQTKMDEKKAEAEEKAAEAAAKAEEEKKAAEEAAKAEAEAAAAPSEEAAEEVTEEAPADAPAEAEEEAPSEEKAEEAPEEATEEEKDESAA